MTWQPTPLNALLLIPMVTVITAQPLAAQNLQIQDTQIQDIQVLEDGMGVEIRITTPPNTSLQMTRRVMGETLFITLPAVEWDSLFNNLYQENTIIGIEAIAVYEVAPDTLELAITGSEVLPTVKVTQVSPDTPTPIAVEEITEQGIQTAEIVEVDDTIELVVTATRTETNILDVPRSVTTVDRETLDQQQLLSNDLQDILSQSVPGLQPPRQQYYAPTLRGRNAQVLIDGVPVGGNFSTGFQRSFRTIEPGAIERIEVVRGASALYGDGASGGVVNIITRRPTENFAASAEIGTDFSLTNVEDSIGYNLRTNISGKEGNVYYTGQLGWTTVGGFFDAAGDRIPLLDNGTADIRTLNFLAKVGADLSPEQNLQLTLNHFTENQDFDYVTDPVVLDLDGLQKARALQLNGDLKFVNADEPGNRNTLLNLEYRHDNLLNSKIKTQLYYRDVISHAAFFDVRAFAENPTFPLRRSVQATERYGGRFQAETPINAAANVLWGFDYSKESISEDFDFFDEAIFAVPSNPILSKVLRRNNVPKYNVENLGIFAQGQWNIADRLILSGGVRHERYGVSIPSFASSFDFEMLTGTDVTGGDRSGSGTVFNGGVVYKVTPELSLFTNFSQGFSLPDIARLLRRPPTNFNFEQDLDLSSPIKVDNYEIGVRGEWQTISASLAAFYNYSDLGASVVFDDPAQPGRLVRTPQKNYGLEAAVDWQATNKFSLGSSLTLMEGKEDFENNGNFTPISSFDIAPLKLTTYVQHQTTPNWRNRLQILYVGDRHNAFEAGVDPVAIHSYFVADLISSFQVGKGILSLGIENLFNTQYIPFTSQFIGGFDETTRYAGKGKTLSLNYRMNF